MGRSSWQSERCGDPDFRQSTDGRSGANPRGCGEGNRKVGKAPYRKIADRREAIQEAIDEAGADDLVLIAGKGHEDYQIIGREVFSL